MAVKHSPDMTPIQNRDEIPDPQSFETIIVATPDLAGRLVGKRVTARSYAASSGTKTCDVIFGWGIGHELLDGFDAVGWDHGYGDVLTQPDPSTLRPLSWWPGTGLVMADAVWENGDPVPFAPRTVLARQVERARAQGLQPLLASELEFTVFAETLASLAEKGYASPGLHRESLHPELVETTDLDEELLGEIRSKMEASRIRIESVKAEYSPSQFEIALDPAAPLEVADGHAIYKLGVRELCRRRQLLASFMAKWDEERGGQSCHLHVSLWDGDGRNVFEEGSDEQLHAFIAGVQRYGPELFLLWAPFPNSFKRFKAGTFAPDSLSWGVDNRTAALRITGGGGSRHLENRIPGADVNPYLAHAALLAAGLAGIEEELTPDEGIGNENAYGRTDLPPIPRGISEAINLFSGSEFAARSFGREVVDHLSNFARAEHNASLEAVTDWDRKRLFEI